jgi:hypothetical protein
LYIWSKCNEEIGYFQGLNDVAVPFFVVYLSAFFSNDLSEISSKLDKMQVKEVISIEADVFWSLHALTDQLKVKKKEKCIILLIVNLSFFLLQ